jgi:hypothetical protein
MQEGCFHIHKVNLHSQESGEYEEQSIGGTFDNRCKSLLVVNTLFLLETSYDKPRLIGLNLTIWSDLTLVDPAAYKRASVV